MPTARLHRPLLDHLEKHCAEHAHECPLGSCVHSPEAVASRTVLTLVDDGPRRVLRDSRCAQCTLVLILQSIERNVPSPQVLAWLDQPLIDLAGRTPRECLDAGELDAVINALWLLDQTELTCG